MTTHPDRSTLQVRLLGPLRVTAGTIDATPTAVKHRLVIALLGLHRSMPSETLIRRLWAEPGASSRNGLQVIVSRLRATVADGLIETCGNEYRLGPDVEVDAHLLMRLARSEATQDLRTVLRMTSRHVLTDLRFDPDIDAFAQMVQRQRVRAATRLAAHELDAGGDPFGAIDLLEQVVRGPFADPEVKRLRAAARHELHEHLEELFERLRHSL